MIKIARSLLLNGAVRGQTAVHKAHRGRTNPCWGEIMGAGKCSHIRLYPGFEDKYSRGLFGQWWERTWVALGRALRWPGQNTLRKEYQCEAVWPVCALGSGSALTWSRRKMLIAVQFWGRRYCSYRLANTANTLADRMFSEVRGCISWRTLRHQKIGLFRGRAQTDQWGSYCNHPCGR